MVNDVLTPQGMKDLVFVVANDDTVYAIDATSGNIAWKKQFRNPLKPKTEATYLCPNTQNASPVIDKQRVSSMHLRATENSGA